MVGGKWGWLDNQLRMSGRSRRGYTHVKEVSEMVGGEVVEAFVGEQKVLLVNVGIQKGASVAA